MNVQDLILTKEEVTPKPTAAPAPQTTRKKSTVEFTVEDFGSGDFCIRRKTSRSEKLLVWLTSQTQFYIKDGKTNEVIPIEAKNVTSTSALSTFFRNWTPYSLPVFGQNFHATKKEKDAMCAFASILRYAEEESNEEHVSNTLKKLTQQNYVNLHFDLLDPANFIPISDTTYFKFRVSHIKPNRRDYRYILQKTTLFTVLCPILQKYYSEEDLRLKLTTNLFFGSCTPFLAPEILCLITAFGIDKTRKYIDQCLALPYVDDSYLYADHVLFSDDYAWIELKDKVVSALRHHTKIDFDKNILSYTFDPDKFIEYVLYQRIREGQAFSPADWFRTWRDTLSMEKRLFGKIKEKYPKNLQTYHNQLSYLYLQKQNAIQKEAIIKRKNELSKYSWSNGKYLIRCPESDTDFLDEAHQQANCLASYADAYNEGKTDIFFMRRVDDPEHSFITIEVRTNGDGQPAIRQAYRASNRKPTAEEMDVIHTWCDKFGIVFNSNYCPMCV